MQVKASLACHYLEDDDIPISRIAPQLAASGVVNRPHERRKRRGAERAVDSILKKFVAHRNFLSVVIVRLYVRPVHTRSKPSGCPTRIIPHHAPRPRWGGLTHAFPGAGDCLTAGRARNALADLTLPQQLRQLGDVGRDAAGVVAPSIIFSCPGRTRETRLAHTLCRFRLGLQSQRRRSLSQAIQPRTLMRRLGSLRRVAPAQAFQYDLQEPSASAGGARSRRTAGGCATVPSVTVMGGR
jgi:hypothetical protein